MNKKSNQGTEAVSFEIPSSRAKMKRSAIFAKVGNFIITFSGKLTKNKLMEKDYGEWHKKKKILNEREDIDNIFFREKEVWWIALGVNVGFEQDGKGEEFRRPILIMKKFNKYLVLAVPLTTRIKKDNKYYVSCSIIRDNLPRMAIISQTRPIDTKRLIDKLGVADDDSYIKIKNAIKAML